jgi:hypothetical protein
MGYAMTFKQTFINNHKTSQLWSVGSCLPNRLELASLAENQSKHGESYRAQRKPISLVRLTERLPIRYETRREKPIFSQDQPRITRENVLFGKLLASFPA